MAYCCPHCGEVLTEVSKRQDYFCTPCHTAVCLDGATTHVYQMNADHTYQIPTESLRRPATLEKAPAPGSPIAMALAGNQALPPTLRNRLSP